MSPCSGRPLETLRICRGVRWLPPFGRLSRLRGGAGCNIALYYYSGFSYLQLRRYLDAARAFNCVLTYIARCARGGALPCWEAAAACFMVCMVCVLRHAQCVHALRNSIACCDSRLG